MKKSLQSYKDLIIDDTNLGEKHETMWKMMAEDEDEEEEGFILKVNCDCKK